MKTVETVDKKESQVSEAVWCDHVHAKGLWLRGRPPAMLVMTEPIHIVIEEGKVKILCPDCFLKAIQLPIFPRSN